MFNADKLKLVAIVLILIAGLAVFDRFSTFTDNGITGAVIDDSGSGVIDNSGSGVPSAHIGVVDVAKGWNLLSASLLARLVSTTCSNDQLSGTLYTYDSSINGYNVFRYIIGSDGKPLQAPSSTVILPYQGAWFENNGDACIINYYEDTISNAFTVPAGWNLLAVNPSWVGKSLSDLTDACDTKGGLFYSSQNPDNPWSLVSKTGAFEQAKVGQGFWMYVDSGQCNFVVLTPSAEVNEKVYAVGFYAVGDHPVDIAYDGTSIWVALESRKDLIRINPLNGYVSVSTDYLGEGTPEGLFFDGTSIWVSLHNPDRMVKVDPATGKVLCAVKDTGQDPYALNYDGEGIWIRHVTTYGAYRLKKVSTDCKPVEDFPKDKMDGSPRYAAFDGENMWVSNYWPGGVKEITKEGKVLKSVKVENAEGIAVASENVWVVGGSPAYQGQSDSGRKKEHDGTLTQIKKTDQAFQGTIISQRVMKNDPQTIGFDGTNLWVTLKTANKVVKLDSSTGNEIGLYRVGQFPVSAVSDGNNLWVVNYDSGDVTELVGVTSGLFR